MSKKAKKDERQYGRCWICDDNGVLSWPVLAWNETQRHHGPTCETHGALLAVAVQCLKATTEPTGPTPADWRWLALHMEAAAGCSRTGRGLSMSWHEDMAAVQVRLMRFARQMVDGGPVATTMENPINAAFVEGMWLAK